MDDGKNYWRRANALKKYEVLSDIEEEIDGRLLPSIPDNNG
jgi:hypothetical protein